jgi:AraC-like DNA-binding protein
MGDRTRLRQIALNLISNAVKFTPAGRVHFEVRVSNESVTISVSDTGMGIPAAELSTIFDEFYRSYDAVQSGEGGMGLGLAITRQLVEQHGGSIEVHSPGQLGLGSTFSFTLPILAGHDLQNDLTPTLHRGNNHVMILSEKGDDLAAVHQYLQASDFEIDICDMDDNWLSRIMALSPTAVLLTEQLASREGWSISGILKRQPATKNTLVLAFSLDHGQVLKLDYLHKPLDPETLTRELERLQMTGGGSATVLVVDDDPGILEMHSRLIEGSGRYAVTARNGREALKSIEQGIPDLILLDLMMPEMDGFAVLDELRSRAATRDIPVIVLTARVLSDADLERCNRGVAAILGKGLFSAEETLKHVETALTQKQTLGKATQTLVRRAMAFIHDHFAGGLTREQIADHVGVSADYLTDCFHQELGITPSTYIRRYRIRQACELLRNTDQSITQVAMTVGFSDGAHFTRTFQREVGMTPRAYRVQGWG